MGEAQRASQLVSSASLRIESLQISAGHFLSSDFNFNCMGMGAASDECYTMYTVCTAGQNYAVLKKKAVNMVGGV